MESFLLDGFGLAPPAPPGPPPLAAAAFGDGDGVVVGPGLGVVVFLPSAEKVKKNIKDKSNSLNILPRSTGPIGSNNILWRQTMSVLEKFAF